MTKHRIERIEWREVVWQRPFSEDNVIEMLTHLATLENRGAIVWESRSRKGYVKHIIGAESRNMNKIAEAIKIHGDIAIYTLPAQTRQLVRTARKLVISKPSLALNTGVMLSTIRAGLAALANVRGDDCAVLQIVLGGSYAPTMVPKSFPDPHASWLQAIFGSTEQITNEARKSVREKSEQHCFQALIRIGASGEYARASINGVLSALRTLESAGVRIYTDSEKAQNINIAHVPWHFPMRLSVKEAASFLMLPIGEDELPGTLGLHPKSVSPPLRYRDPINRMNDRTFALSQDGVNSKKLSISPKDGLEHTILLGPTGSGKSTAMQNLILSDIYAGRSVLVIDPKADLVKKLESKEAEYDEAYKALKDLVDSNSNRLQNQDEYTKKFNEAESRFQFLEKEISELNTKIAAIKAQREKIAIYINALKADNKIIEEFNEDLWYAFVDKVTLYADNQLNLQFKDGSDMSISIDEKAEK